MAGQKKAVDVFLATQLKAQNALEKELYQTKIKVIIANQ
jgi:hypothetical protein